MHNDETSIVTAETLMRKVEELLFIDELSEEEKCEMLRDVLSILEEE